MSWFPTEGPHFFVDPDDVEAEQARLRGDDARHLVVVLRARSGQSVSVSDGRGVVWQGRFARAEDDAVLVTLTERFERPDAAPRITVVHALPKQRKLDEVVQRLTEVGVRRIVPVSSARSEVRLDAVKADKAVVRWRAVALAAAKQSRRSILPDIAPVTTWSAAFAQPGAGVTFWEESTVPLRAVLSAFDDPPEVTVAIGPEGGLTPAEVTATGLPHASLGDTILRTETAALVAVSAVRYHFDLLTPTREEP